MYQKNPSITKGIDWLMVWLYISLILFGLVCIFTVEYNTNDDVLQTLLGFKKEYSKQFYFFIISLVVAIFVLLTDSKFFTATANLGYAFGILLIVYSFIRFIRFFSVQKEEL